MYAGEISKVESSFRSGLRVGKGAENWMLEVGSTSFSYLRTFCFVVFFALLVLLRPLLFLFAFFEGLSIQYFYFYMITNIPVRNILEAHHNEMVQQRFFKPKLRYG